MGSAELMPSRGTLARQDFGGQELAVMAETAAAAVAAQAKAAVEARYILALRRPREWEDVRVRLEKACRRPTFAAVARYQKPIGRDKSKWPTGPSIRFAEEALRAMGNAYPETRVIYESDDQRIVEVSVTDLEANLTYSTQVVIQKTVERRQPRDGQEVIGKRQNSNGDTVYIVRATEDDLLNKQNALISKALRTAALRLLPGDILDRCMEIVVETQESGVREDPDAARRRLVDAFNAIGVGPADLAQYLGHPLERIQPAEVVELRTVYATIKDGETTWEQIMEARNPAGTVEAAQDVARAKLAALKAQTAPTETPEEHDARLERQMAEQQAAALAAEAETEKPKPAVKIGRRG